MGVIKLKGTVKQITVNPLEDMSSSHLPSFICSDVAEEYNRFC